MGILKHEKPTSVGGDLNKKDFRNQARTALKYLAVPIGFYISMVLGRIQLENHQFNFQDFIPSRLVYNSIATWFFMQIQGLLSKLTKNDQITD